MVVLLFEGLFVPQFPRNNTYAQNPPLAPPILNPPKYKQLSGEFLPTYDHYFRWCIALPPASNQQQQQEAALAHCNSCCCSVVTQPYAVLVNNKFVVRGATLLRRPALALVAVVPSTITSGHCRVIIPMLAAPPFPPPRQRCPLRPM